MPAIPIIAAVATVASVAVAAKGVSNAKKAADDAAKAAANPPQVNIPALQTQAQQIALQNATNSAALEQQFNPGAAELRSGGLQALLASLNMPTTERDALMARIAAQAGSPLNVPDAQQYDSALTRAAIQAASDQLALGGQLPQDVQNLVTRNALAKSGQVSGGLYLGRDLSTRDLGLTSLQLQNQRIAQAAALGQQEASLEAGNANLRAGTDAQRVAAEQYARSNLLQSADFINSVTSGDFSRALAAAQLGQNIAQPASGLDPGSVANLAVGNMNSAASGQQQANALGVGVGNAQTQLGMQALGTTLGFAQNYFKPTTYAYTSPTTYGAVGYTPPATNYAGSMAPVMCWVAREVFGQDNPEWMAFRDWLLSEGSPELVEFYGQNGPDIAAQIKDMPAVKTLIKHLMVAAKGGS